MGRWLEQSAQELAKITDRMHELLLDCNVLQVDESPYDLIDKNRAGKKIKKGYVWTLFGDALAPYVYFPIPLFARCSHPTRSGNGSN